MCALGVHLKLISKKHVLKKLDDMFNWTTSLRSGDPHDQFKFSKKIIVFPFIMHKTLLMTSIKYEDNGYNLHLDSIITSY